MRFTTTILHYFLTVATLISPVFLNTACRSTQFKGAGNSADSPQSDHSADFREDRPGRQQANSTHPATTTNPNSTGESSSSNSSVDLVGARPDLEGEPDDVDPPKLGLVHLNGVVRWSKVSKDQVAKIRISSTGNSFYRFSVNSVNGSIAFKCEAVIDGKISVFCDEQSYPEQIAAIELAYWQQKFWLKDRERILFSVIDEALPDPGVTEVEGGVFEVIALPENSEQEITYDVNPSDTGLTRCKIDGVPAGDWRACRSDGTCSDGENIKTMCRTLYGNDLLSQNEWSYGVDKLQQSNIRCKLWGKFFGPWTDCKDHSMCSKGPEMKRFCATTVGRLP